MEYLYGNQRKVFKVIYKNHKKNKIITKYELSKILKLPYIDVERICKELSYNGFISYVGLNFNPKLTVKGVDYFSSETSTSIETFIKSIVCPIIVSIITTSLMLLLNK